MSHRISKEPITIPNLDYDPKDPRDLLGEPVAPGDTVAWGTTYGKSAGLCVAVIEDIVFTKKNPNYTYSNKEYLPCDQHEAERYTLRLRPLKSTGSVTWLHADGSEAYEYRYRDQPGEFERMIQRGQIVAKVKTVLHVKNIVKLADR